MANLLLPPGKKIGPESGAIIRAGNILPEKKTKIKTSSFLSNNKQSSSLANTDKTSSVLVKTFDASNKSLTKIEKFFEKDKKDDAIQYKKDKDKKKRDKDKKRKDEIEKNLEAKLGLSLPNLSGLKLPGVKKPGFLQRLFDALLWLGLGWIVDKLLDKESWFNKIGEALISLGTFLDKFLPAVIQGIFDFAGKAFPFIVGVGKGLYSVLVSAIDTTYSVYNELKYIKKSVLGSEAFKKLDAFLGTLDKFFIGTLAFASAWALLNPPKPDEPPPPPPGPDRGRGGISSGGGKPSPIKEFLSRDPKSRSIFKNYGRNAETTWNNAFNNAVKSGKTPTQARRSANAAVDRLIKSGKIKPQIMPGLKGPDLKRGNILRRGFPKAATRLGIKVLGKEGLKAVKGVSGRIPIAGPIFVAVSSILSDEPVNKAIFRAFGSVVGGVIGAGIGLAGGPLSVFGAVVGQAAGEWLGGSLYDLLYGEGDKQKLTKKLSILTSKLITQHIKGNIKKITDSIVNTFKFVTSPTKILEVLSNVIKKVVGTGQKLYNFLFDNLKNAFNSIPKLIEFLLDFIKKLPGGMQAIRAIAGVGQIISDVASNIKSVAGTVGSGAGKLAAKTTSIVSKAVSPIMSAWDWMGKKLAGTKEFAAEQAKRISAFTQEQIGKIKTVGTNISNKSKELVSSVKSFAGKIGDNTKRIFLEKIIEPLKEKLKPLVKKASEIKDVLLKQLEKIPGYDRIISALKKKGIKGIGDAPNIMKQVGAKGLPFIGGIFNLLFSIDRFKEGDASGGTLEFISGLLDLMSVFSMGAGGGASLAIDAYLLVRDLVPQVLSGEKELFSKVPGFGSYSGTAKQVASNLPSFSTIASLFGGPEKKNRGGMVGLNDGGIMPNIKNNMAMVNDRNESFKMNLPTNFFNFSPQFSLNYNGSESPLVSLMPIPFLLPKSLENTDYNSSRVNTISNAPLSSSVSDRYDVKKFDRMLDYEQQVVENTKVAILVKPIVIR